MLIGMLFIRFATTAKIVNVKKLKADIWAEVDTLPTAVDKTDASSSQDSLSFQELVADVAQCQSQKDVSISFYFICLLHLANEKVWGCDFSG